MTILVSKFIIDRKPFWWQITNSWEFQARKQLHLRRTRFQNSCQWLLGFRDNVLLLCYTDRDCYARVKWSRVSMCILQRGGSWNFLMNGMCFRPQSQTMMWLSGMIEVQISLLEAKDFFLSTRTSYPLAPDRVVSKGIRLCIKSENTKTIQMKNITSIHAFWRLTLKFRAKLFRKSHQLAFDCLINNEIEWATVISCTSDARPWNYSLVKYKNSNLKPVDSTAVNERWKHP